MKTESNGILEARSRAGSFIEHGGPDIQELRRAGLDPAQILDFSVCTNPYGPSPRVYDALAKVALDRYPDREAHEFRAALAEICALRPEQILAGNGVSELLWLTSLALVRPGERVLVIGPTYGEYARSALLQSGKVSTFNAREQDRFALSDQEIGAEINRCRPRLTFLCNPNNPTGTLLASEVILSWARQNPGTIFVVDEAYQKFAPGSASLVAAQENNLLVLRSMTKDYALAGLRIGYAVGPEKVIDALARVRPPWSVNALAQAAAVAALRDEDHDAQSLEDLARAKQVLVNGLTDLDLPVCPSATHFFLVRVGDASALRRALLRRGILVRNAASFGLPEFVRVATRRPEDNVRLLAVLREVTW